MKNRKAIITIVVVLIISLNISAQVAVNTDGSSADGSAMLEVKSSTKGFLPPRMTEDQRDDISDPATGLIIYQTDGTAGLYQYNGVAWEAIGGSSADSHYVGELYGGGVVFWVDQTGQHGIIAGMIDLSDRYEWSNVHNIEIGSSAQSDWNGSGNTTAIIAQENHTESAAKLCEDYTNVDYGTGVYNDWYLPSIAELSHIWNNFYDLQKALTNDGSDLTKPLGSSYYWSSTEFGADMGLEFTFLIGRVGYTNKWSGSFVRAVRAF